MHFSYHQLSEDANNYTVTVHVAFSTDLCQLDCLCNESFANFCSKCLHITSFKYVQIGQKDSDLYP